MDSAAGKQKSPQTDNPGGDAKPTRNTTNKYAGFSIIELAKLIFENSDAAALKELTEKRKPIFHNDEWVSMVEFIDRLRQSEDRLKYAFGTIQEIEDITSRAVVILYARFTNLHRNTGPDCRNQYRELLRQVRNESTGTGECLKTEMETIVPEKLSSLLETQFVHCLKEANREANDLFHRYTWQSGELKVELKRPAWISTRNFKEWLKENTQDFRIEDRKARRRIQDKIYEEFGRGGFFQLEEIGNLADEPEEPVSQVNNLIEDVAEKIAAEFKDLKPSIRVIGRAKVKKLIIKILESRLKEDGCKDTEIAKEFGLSKSAFSRFAGRWWKQGEITSVPDLWRNVGELVMGDAKYTSAILESGTKNNIEKTLRLVRLGREGVEHGQ